MDYVKKLEELLNAYNNTKNSSAKQAYSEMILKVSEKLNSHYTKINDQVTLEKINNLCSDFNNEQIGMDLDLDVIEKNNNVKFDFFKKHKKMIASGLVLASLITGVTAITNFKQSPIVSADSSDKEKEQLNVFDEKSIENRGLELAKVLGQYGQLEGFSSDDLTYLGLLTAGEMPDGYTAKKFDLGNMMSKEEAKKTGELLWSSFNNITMYGIKDAEVKNLADVFENEMDKKVVGELFVAYSNVKNTPNEQTKAEWQKFLDTYLGTYHVRTSALVNTGIIIPAVDSINNYLPEFSDTTAAVITTAGKCNDATVCSGVENSSAYSESRKEFIAVYEDIIAQEKFAKNGKESKTELDLSGQEISDIVKEKMKNIENKNIDIQEEVKGAMLGAYDATPEEKARLKIGPNDVIKTDSNGIPYIKGESKNENNVGDEIKDSNKDANGNNTNMSADELKAMATKAFTDFNNGTRDESLYASNATYKSAWDQAKQISDSSSMAPPAQDNVVDEKENTVVVPTPPVANPTPPAATPDPIVPPALDEGTVVPPDYVPPTPGEIVDEDTKEEFVPSANLLNDYGIDDNGNFIEPVQSKTR